MLAKRLHCNGIEIWNLSPWPGDQLNGRGDNSCSLGWTRQDETIGYVNTALLVEYALWFESLITTSRPNKNNVDHSNWLGQSSTPRTQHSTNRTFSWETFGSPSLLSGFCSCVIRIIGNKNWNKILCFLLSSLHSGISFKKQDIFVHVKNKTNAPNSKTDKQSNRNESKGKDYNLKNRTQTFHFHCNAPKEWTNERCSALPQSCMVCHWIMPRIACEFQSEYRIFHFPQKAQAFPTLMKLKNSILIQANINTNTHTRTREKKDKIYGMELSCFCFHKSLLRRVWENITGDD